MELINVSKRSLGVCFGKDGTAEVRVWAPLANKLELVVVPNGKRIALQGEEYGYWQADTKELRPGDRYRFILDGEQERPDPASLSQPEGVHGPSAAYDPARFPWTDQQWHQPPLEEYILYELHTGTFTPEGTFAGIASRLDYLKELGVTAIEIMPVAQFPGDRNWGYDGVFPFAVQHSYGGAEGLQQLVDACHAKGIVVVLDVVYNHFGPEGNYLGDFAPYFTGKYRTPWGDAVNFDDAWCDGVRRYYTENALMWFRDFHIDALRLDAVHAIKDFSPSHILRDIRLATDRLMEETGRRHYLIVEVDLNDPRYISSTQEGGYGMDAQWVDEFHHALRVTTGQEQTGYYADFEGIRHLAKSYRDAYVYDGQYSPHRLKHFGAKARKHPGRQFTVFSQNHDQVGNRMLGERSSQLVSLELQKVMAAAVLVSPFLPLLFMGEEWSAPNPFLYFVSHTDPELAAAIRRGRQEEFAAFHAAGEAPDPMDEATFNQSKLQWELTAQEPHATLLRYYRTLIRLRKMERPLHCLSRQDMGVVEHEAGQTLLLDRWYEEQHVLCLMNFSKAPQTLTLPAYEAQWKKLLDSAAPEWGGPAAAPETLNARTEVTLQPESFLMYSNSHA